MSIKKLDMEKVSCNMKRLRGIFSKAALYIVSEGSSAILPLQERVVIIGEFYLKYYEILKDNGKCKQVTVLQNHSSFLYVPFSLDQHHL